MMERQRMEEEKIEEAMEELEEQLAIEDDDSSTQTESEEAIEDVSMDKPVADEVLENSNDDDEEVEIETPQLENTEENQLRLLEAILFATNKPISPQVMLERLPEGADLNVLLPRLQEQYSGRGIELVEIGGQWALRTARDVGSSLVVEKEVQKKMSKAALETLAIVAYHQPITRGEIENIRGVATHKGTLDILMEMGWVKPGRRRETPGRPLTWVTSNGFLDHFQLEALTDLPGLEELKSSGLLDKRAAIETIPDTADLFENPDEDAEEVLDSSDDDAYDEASYKEMKKKAQEETMLPAKEGEE